MICVIEVSSPRIPTTARRKFVVSPCATVVPRRHGGTGRTRAPRIGGAAMLLDRYRLLPGLSSSIRERISLWMGHRQVCRIPAGDRRIRASPDVFHAFGHGHVGMTGAPTTAASSPIWWRAGAPIDLAPFRGRPLRRIATVVKC